MARRGHGHHPKAAGQVLQVGAPDGVPVHRGCIERRNQSRCTHGSGQHSTVGHRERDLGRRQRLDAVEHTTQCVVVGDHERSFGSGGIQVASNSEVDPSASKNRWEGVCFSMWPMSSW